MSASGARIVGISSGQNGSLGDAFLWDPVNGIRDLQDVLVNEYGVSIPAGWLLRDATALSPDGRFIVGYGNNPDGKIEAWLADIGPEVPEPAAMLLGLIGCIAAFRCGARCRQAR
ncbi:MAG: hypothetical protein IT425_08545 [Pirellulales bacterium]|nr:hypothetical protein [Pirellulales bacterium]